MISPPVGSERISDRATLARFLSDRVDVHVYALGDLDEPYWSASTWWRRGDALVGIVGLPDGEGTACYAVSSRSPSATVELIVDIAPYLPAGHLITGPTGMCAALAGVRSVRWCEPHERYVLTDPSALVGVDTKVERLGRGDAEELALVYSTEPGAGFFLPHMLNGGVFFGFRESDRLVAVAGTHVLSDDHGVAAIGGVFTIEEYRGRGYARMLTSAVASTLLDRVTTIGLNVATSNVAARAVYESLGFSAVLSYEETELGEHR